MNFDLRRIVVIGFSCVLALVAAQVSLAATINVDSSCSLANAIRSANGDAQISPNDSCETGDSGADTITLTSNITVSDQPPFITSNVDIDGGGHTVSDGITGSQSSLLTVQTTGDLTLRNITFSGFNLNYATIHAQGRLEMRDCVVKGHRHSNHIGGALVVSTSHKVVVNRCAFIDNGSLGKGGGAIELANGTLLVSNSAFIDNNCSSGGCAIYMNNGTDQVELFHNTFWNNKAGISGRAGAVSQLEGLLYMRNSILGVASNPNNDPLCSGTIQNSTTARGIITFNAVSSGCGAATTGDPKFGAQAGPVPFLPLKSGSAAHGTGIASTCAAYPRDQRGAPRPATGCDSGAVEWDGFNHIYVDSGCSLSQAFSAAQNNNNGGASCEAGLADASAPDVIWLSADVSLSAALTDATSTIIVEGGGYTISHGAGVFRPFNVGSGGDLTLRDLTISGFTQTSGAAIYSRGKLHLEDCLLKDNTDTGSGGGAIRIDITATETTVNRCAFINNRSNSESGGAIRIDGGRATVSNSTFLSNSCSGSGCAIFADSGADGVELTHDTFWDNTTDNQVNVSAIYGNPNSGLSIYNSIIGRSATAASGLCGKSGNSQEPLGNIMWNGTSYIGCGIVTIVNPQLGAQTGNPPYLPLSAGSAAIGAGIASGCAKYAIDQAGNYRPATGCDIGALQYIPSTELLIAEASIAEFKQDGGAWVQLADGTWKWLPQGKSVEDVQRQTCSGEELNKLGQVRVWATYGLCSGVQFKRLEAGWLTGNQRVIDAGFLDAVDVYGYAEQGVEVCFPAYGAVVLLDAASSPRTLEPLDAYLDEHYTCAAFNKAGTAVLISANSGLASPPVAGGPSAGLANCMVTTTYVLNLRAEPNGNVIGMVAHDSTLTALSRTEGWFEVDANGVVGWISADYVTTAGACG